MDKETLRKLYQLNHYTVKSNTDGVSQQDSLLQPEPAGNYMNWVLGHITVTRNSILELLGQPPVLKDDANRYARGSEALKADNNPEPFDKILSAFHRSQEMIDSALAKLDNSDLNRTVADDETLGHKLALFHFHEAYHCGQVGLLRRLCGKPGAIK